jgi:hypothetical protein
MKRIARLFALALSLTLAAAAPSFAADGSAWRPDGVFVQGGAWSHVVSGTVGLTWDWRWQHEYTLGTLTGYTEVDLGRWQTRGRPDNRGFTQVGITPVFRLYPHGIAAGWFAEIAVGANVITPRYHNDTRVFGSNFNFGDHVGVGRRFGAQQENEVALRFEHFSNGGYKHPNPGENFVQARYLHRF